MKIGVLNCNTFNPDFKAQFESYPKMFAEAFGRTSQPIEMVSYNTIEGHLPDDINECDAYIITGSPYSVFEHIDWIRACEIFIKKCVANNKKLVGICFGHQLIAHALGGRVARSEKGWGIGAMTYECYEQPSWMQPQKDAFSMLISHQDQVIEPPKNAKTIAGNDFCPHAALQIGDHVISFQAHPEYTKDYLKALLATRVDIIEPERFQAGMDSLEQDIDHHHIIKWITCFLKGQPM